MDHDSEGQRIMSLRLSRVLEDIGITRQMVNRRRTTMLVTEKTTSVVLSSLNKNMTIYYFGSQSEGTTTLGMNSDVDCLRFTNDRPVLLDWSEWQLTPDVSLLVLQDESSPPQHCNLQILRHDLPLPATLDMVNEDLDVIDIEGRVFVKNTTYDSIYKKDYGADFIKQGPSRSRLKTVDFVSAFHCVRLPKECQFLFHRPRPGHWPTTEILEQAGQTGTFFVPQGHPESSCQTLEWRFSTSLIERLLMFDLTLTKVKAYTFLKMLRKVYFKPIVGDRFSTFHFKTALLFSIESYPPELWQEDNLLQCVVFCLTTLRRWFRMHYFPHYTISGVDLFVGKLKKFELHKISAMLSNMTENIMVYVVHIEMDGVGRRMLQLTGDTHTHMKSRRYENTVATAQICFKSLLNQFSAFIHLWQRCDSALMKSMLEKNIMSLIDVFMQNSLGTCIKDQVKATILFLYNQLASIKASMCIELHQPITADIYSMYQASLDSDMTSSRLKFASMLYCTNKNEDSNSVGAH